jgi:YggT family protein
MSWLPVSGSNQLLNSAMSFIYDVTEPFLAPFRRIIPMSSGMPIDFSPILAFFVLGLIQSLVFSFI